MNANAESGDKIAARIVECFKQIYKSDKVRISYDIAKMKDKLDSKLQYFLPKNNNDRRISYICRP